MEFFSHWPLAVWLLALAAALLAAVAHGAIGFGFPLLSTPLIALITDVRTAVLTTLIPNLVLNVISVVRGENWRATLASYWPLAAYVLAGTVVGTWVLSYADPRVLKLLLAGIIVVYLVQERLRGPGEGVMHRHPRTTQAVCGLAGGFFSGTVNVAVPPILIYFSTLTLPPLVVTQAMNLSFLVGRSTQGVALLGSGQLGPALIGVSFAVSVLAAFALTLGFRLQRRIHADVFARVLRRVLWAMAASLAAQAAYAYLR